MECSCSHSITILFGKQGCPKCALEKLKYDSPLKKTQEQFIEECKMIHGDKDDFSKVNYINNKEKICLICKEHGEYWQKPLDYLHGHRCKKCANEKLSEISKIKYTYEQLVSDGNEAHNNKYIYPQQDIKYLHQDCIVECEKHGLFKTNIYHHIHDKRGCQKCAMEKFNLAKRYSIEKIKEMLLSSDYDRAIDIDLSEYEKMNTPIRFHCNTCGKDFYRQLTVFINSNNKCPHCFKEVLSKAKTKTTEEYINQVRKIHNGFYIYDLVNYTKSDEKIDVICPKHGIFSIEANSHAQGHGCPICNESKLEKEISSFLTENGIIIERQKRFDWLGRMSIDIYIPSLQIAIECQGEQHFEIVEYFGGKSAFERRIFLDNEKLRLCNENGIKMIYYSNRKYAENVITNKEELLNVILCQEN